MKTGAKRYVLEMLVAGMAYILILFAVNAAYCRWEEFLSSSGWRFVLAILPMIPAVFVVKAIVRHLHRVDEMEQAIQLRCLAIAFGATAFVTFTYGFLEGAGLPKLSMFVVWPVMAVCWLLARVVVGRSFT
ncbi:MAG: hypothetical protein AAGH89_14800 [Verrucomicrobiota bacterium]